MFFPSLSSSLLNLIYPFIDWLYQLKSLQMPHSQCPKWEFLFPSSKFALFSWNLASSSPSLIPIAFYQLWKFCLLTFYPFLSITGPGRCSWTIAVKFWLLCFTSCPSEFFPLNGRQNVLSKMQFGLFPPLMITPRWHPLLIIMTKLPGMSFQVLSNMDTKLHFQPPFLTHSTSHLTI